MRITEFTFPSSTGVSDIHAFRCLPGDDTYDTVLVINHGMAEEHNRYEAFAEFLCKKGVAVYMHDMAGHGKSCAEPLLKGWFGEKEGYLGLTDDLHTMVMRAAEENPGRKIFVLGHSMGSFICRLYVIRYHDEISGAVFMGTGGPNPAAGMGKALSSLIGTIRGKKYKSKLLHAVIFGTYNKGFEGRTSFDWLSRDPVIAENYIANPEHGFLFTVWGIHDLIDANVACNSFEWYEKVPQNLPILIVSGEKDPVGDHSRGVRIVYEHLKATGHDKVTEKIYTDCRHEVLNELNRDEVMADILEWIEEVYKGEK